MSQNNGLLGGYGQYPGNGHDQMSFAHPDTTSGLAPYVSPRNMQNKPYQAVPRVADTLFFSHQDKIRQILEYVFIKVEDMDGWEFKFAPRTATTDMNEVVTIRTMDDYVLENTAELTAPRVLDLREEQYSISMEHYQLGLKVYGENLRTPKGLQELADKMKGFANASVITMKLLVKASIINAPNYWMQQFSMTQRYNNIQERTVQERQMFGALTKDPKGLYKIWSMLPEYTKYAPRKPEWNMCVVPPKLALQHQWRHDGTTEAWRVGDATAQRNKTMASDALLASDIPVTVYIDKEYNPVNADNRLPIDAFKRRSMIGAYAVLEYCDKGPTDPISGQPCPAVRCVTLPENNYTEFTLRDCINHCARFGSDGSITDFTRGVIESENDISRVWDDDEGGYNRALYDPWVYQPNPVGNSGVPHLKVCELFGEQDTRHRPEEFDVQQGKKFAEKLNLTDDEKTQIGLLFDAAQHLYEVPTADSGTFVAATFAQIAGPTDDEWGGPYFNTTGVFTNAGNSIIPYGFGDIFSVMSMLKHLTPDQRTELNKVWSYGSHLKYDIIRKTLYKIWKQVKEMFPMLGTKNADAVPSFRKAGKKDNNEMISVFRGLFERVKHPVWNKTARPDVYIVGGGNWFTSYADVRRLRTILQNGQANIAGREVTEFLKTTDRTAEDAAYISQKGEGMPGTLKAAITDILTLSDGSDLNEETAIAMTLQFVLKVIGQGRVRLSKTMVEQFFESAKVFATQRGEPVNVAGEHRARPAGGDDYTNTLLTVWKDAYKGDGRLNRNNDFVATNALIGDVPLVGDGGYTNDRDTYAQAHLTRQSDAEFQARTPKFGVFEDGNVQNFGKDPAQFIDARRANELGGGFLFADLVDIDGTPQVWLVERQYMSRRAIYIGKQLADDPIARLGAFCFIMSKVHRDSCLALLDHGLLMPMNFILAWPFIQIDTLAMMFAEGGSQTARLNYGFSDVTNPEDGIHKIHEWNGTTVMGAGVINPMNYILFPDVAMAGYVSGLSSKFIPKTWKGASRGMKFSDPHNDGCFAMDVPVTFSRKTAVQEHHNPLPLFGKHDPEQYTGIYSQRGDIFNPQTPHFPSWPAYNYHYKFDAINENARYDGRSYRALKESRYIPGTMFLRNTQTYNPLTGEYHFVGGTRGTGHLDDIDPEKVNFKSLLDGAIEFRDSYASFAQ